MINSLRMRRGLGYGILSIGCVLTVVASLGEWSNLGDYVSTHPRSWERFDSDLVSRTPDLEGLFVAANQRTDNGLGSLGAKRTMQVLFETTTDRFTHGATMHTPFSNWILWSMGKIHPAFGAIRDPGNLLKRGESALCSDSSYVLMQLAIAAGIRARHVGLNGHVVMEAWYDGDWHMYDPDFEVVPYDDSGAVLSVQALSEDEVTIRNLYAGKLAGELDADEVIRIITSRYDNSFVSFPPGSQFEWKSQVLLRAEQVADVFKFIVPTIMILLAGVLLVYAGHSRTTVP